MLIENEEAVKLVELLKASKKLNQKKTTVSFNSDGSRCSLFLSWKFNKRKDLYCADADTGNVFCIMAAWAMTGEI